MGFSHLLRNSGLALLLVACGNEAQPLGAPDCSTRGDGDCPCPAEQPACNSPFSDIEGNPIRAMDGSPVGAGRDAAAEAGRMAMGGSGAPAEPDTDMTSGSMSTPSDSPTDVAMPPATGEDAMGAEAGSEGDANAMGSMGETFSPGGGFVGEHGALRARGNRIVDAHEEPLQLRGMSLFWSQWTDFYVAQNVDVLVDDWRANLVRAALGVENDGGYLQDPASNVTKVREIVDQAIARDIYVIIDWHDHTAHSHAAEAAEFFEQMAADYGQQPHVIFEIFNEPVEISWSEVKAYAEPLIRTIRDAGAKNLIIVGTPTWSQDVDLAAADPIRSDDNVAYTLHFYANTHKEFLRDKARVALDQGIALFATEWGTCSANGDGTIDEGETQTWLDFLAENDISWANWALNNKEEACSAVQPSGGSIGPWQDDQLTASGRFVKAAIP